MNTYWIETSKKGHQYLWRQDKKDFFMIGHKLAVEDRPWLIYKNNEKVPSAWDTIKECSEKFEKISNEDLFLMLL